MNKKLHTTDIDYSTVNNEYYCYEISEKNKFEKISIKNLNYNYALIITISFFILSGSYTLFTYHMESTLFKELGAEHSIYDFNLLENFLGSSNLLVIFILVIFLPLLMIIIYSCIFYSPKIGKTIYENKKLRSFIIYLLYIILFIIYYFFAIGDFFAPFFNAPLLLVIIVITIILSLVIIKYDILADTSQEIVKLIIIISSVSMFIYVIAFPKIIINNGKLAGKKVSIDIKNLIWTCEKESTEECQNSLNKFDPIFSQYALNIIPNITSENRTYILKCDNKKCTALRLIEENNEFFLESYQIKSINYSKKIQIKASSK